MKKLFILVILIRATVVMSQELLLMGAAWTPEFNFEDTAEYRYVQIDTNKVWFIAKPQKDILFLPGNIPSLGQYAIFTDTAQYYEKNCKASFQFKILLMEADVYTISFYQKYDFELNKDGGIIETSYDDGNTWQNILYDTLVMNHIVNLIGFDLYSIDDTIEAFKGQPGFTGTFSDGRYFGVSWENWRMVGDTMLLRFTFASDSSDIQHEGWMLDYFEFGGFLVPIDGKQDIFSFTVYPNPVKDQLNISKPILSSKVVTYSITGNLIKEIFCYDCNAIDVSSLQSGIYLLKIIDNDQNCYTIKFTKI